jgi:hypothetical protein
VTRDDDDATMFETDVREYVAKTKTCPWAANAPRDAPLYAPYVNAGNVAGLRDYAREAKGARDPTTKQLGAVVEWLEDPAHHQRAAVRVDDSNITDAQLQQLLAADILRPAPDGPPSVRAMLRKEEKRSGWRLRTILHTHAANDGAHMFTPAMMRVNSVSTLKRMAYRNKFGATRDFMSFFHQMKYNPAVQALYTIRVRGKTYALNRAAMGHKASAAAAHSITRAIAILAAQDEAEWDVIIDDVAFFAQTQEALDRVTGRFDEICGRFGFTIGSSTDAATSVSHRGIDFDLTSNRVRVRETTRNRTIRRAQIYADKPTPAKARSLLGAAVAAAQVVSIPVAQLMLETARYLNGGPPADFRPLQLAIDGDAENAPTAEDPLPYVGAVVADATPTTFGGIYVDQHGNVYYAVGSFPADAFDSINEAEACATLETLALVPDRRDWSLIDVFSDNQVWCRVMGRDWSKTLRIDVLRQQLTRRLTAKRLVPRNSWVASGDNPTDGISRHRPWTADDTAKLHALLGRVAAG